jgi:hypothetical protein
LLIELISYIKNNPKKTSGILFTYILLMIVARLQTALSYVSQPIIRFMKAPFGWWDRIVWVKRPPEDTTNKWVGFNPNNINFDDYIEIVDTGIQNKKKHAHYSTDLDSYGTDAKEFAFYKNMGEFKFGVALLFMKTGNIKEENRQKFEVGSGFLQYISQVDKKANNHGCEDID